MGGNHPPFGTKPPARFSLAQREVGERRTPCVQEEGRSPGHAPSLAGGPAVEQVLGYIRHEGLGPEPSVGAGSPPTPTTNSLLSQPGDCPDSRLCTLPHSWGRGGNHPAMPPPQPMGQLRKKCVGRVAKPPLSNLPPPSQAPSRAVPSSGWSGVCSGGFIPPT